MAAKPLFSFSSVGLAVSIIVSILVPAIILTRRFSHGDGSKNSNNGPSQRQRRLPPSPRGLPFIGHLHLLGSLPHRSLRSIAASHGPVVLLRLGRVRAVVVSSAAGAEEAMKTRDVEFASRPASAMADRLLYGCRDVAFAPYGEYWRQARRVCVAHLLSARRIQSFSRVREQEARKLVDRIRCSAEKKQAVDLSELLMAYANAIVMRAAVGDECSRGLFGEDNRELRKVFTDFHELLATEPIGVFLPCLAWVDALTGTERRIKRTFKALDAVLQKVIDDHLRRQRTQEEHHRDFVDVLLDVNKNDDEYGIRLDTNEIKAIILDMFAAGTDTSTTTMEWAMAELVTHPRAMRKLQQEIRDAVGNRPQLQQVTEEHLDLDGLALPYLKCVIKEALRLHAPVPLLVPRETVEDTELLGYHVPARTRVMINAWAIGRDPATWGHDAEEFLPERFAGDDPAEPYVLMGLDFRFVPFGAGRRGCPGVGFAAPSIELALASLLYHFDWEPVAALDMTEMNGIAMHMKSGLPLVPRLWIPS